MKCIFRTEAHPQIGMGHIVRCLAFADWLKLYGVQCSFVLTENADTDSLLAFNQSLEKQIMQHNFSVTWTSIQNSKFDIILDEHQEYPAWIVLDSYGLGQAWLDQAKSLGFLTVVIDDHPAQKRNADVVIDATLFCENQLRWVELDNDSIHFLGAKFYLASIEMASQNFIKKSKNITTDYNIKHWFLSFGGTDVKQYLPIFLRALGKIVTKDSYITVAINPNVAHMHLIKSALVELPCKCQIIYESHDVITALAHADIAIGAAGGMTIERLIFEVPSVVVQVADNQAEIIRQLKNHQLAYVLDAKTISDNQQLVNELQYILHQLINSNDLNINNKVVSQGLGASWISQWITRTMNSDVYLRAPDKDFCERLFAWQSLAEIRRFSRYPQSPTREEHEAWYKKFTSKFNSVIAEIVFVNIGVGMARLDFKSSEPLTFEVSILIEPEYQKKGIAKAALLALRKLVPFGDFVAYIQPNNTASLKLFKNVGYAPAEVDDYYKLTPFKH